MEGKLDINEYDSETGKLKQDFGREKGSLSKKSTKSKNMDRIQKLEENEKLLDKYCEAIKATIKGKPYLIKKR